MKKIQKSEIKHSVQNKKKANAAIILFHIMILYLLYLYTYIM